MMFKGFVVLAVMAAVWCEFSYLLTQAQRALYIWPPLVSLAFVVVAYPIFAKVPARSATEEKRIGRLIGRWTLFEGVAFLIVANVLANTGLAAFIPAALAIIVGLHFLPLAHGVPMPLYYGTGVIMIVAGSLAMFLPSAFGTRALGLSCAAVLWLTAGSLAWMARHRTSLPTTEASAR